MGQVLHGPTTATEAVRRVIQHSQERVRALAKRYGINQKAVAKWKKRPSVADLCHPAPQALRLSGHTVLPDSSSLRAAYAG